MKTCFIPINVQSFAHMTVELKVSVAINAIKRPQ